MYSLVDLFIIDSGIKYTRLNGEMSVSARSVARAVSCLFGVVYFVGRVEACKEIMAVGRLR